MEEIRNLLSQSVEVLFGMSTVVELERPEEQFGDFSTNVAMRLAGQIGQSPREIADQIASKLVDAGTFKEVSVAGPGFINIRVHDQQLASVVGEILNAGEDFGHIHMYEGKTVVAEYSDPNPFKAMHAGHLYTTLVGDAIANLLEIAGARVARVNFGGDVGLHAATAMWGIIKQLGGENPETLASIPADQRAVWIGQQYAAGHTSSQDDELVKQEIAVINKRIYELHEKHDHDSAFAQIYWTCRQWSYDGFEELYRRLAVHSFDKYYPESSTAASGTQLVSEGLERGIFEVSDGAVIYAGEKDGLHTRVFLTKEGLPTYEAKDLGLVVAKWDDYHFDLSFMITGNDIVEYMKVVQAASAHFHPEITARTKHLTHGMIKLPGGQKMSSRKGNILLADDILDAAASANTQQTGQDNFEAVLAAVKYSFLKQRIGGDIIYDPAESVSILGNSGPYLQYAHARACSILQKISEQSNTEYTLGEGERSLVRKLSMFREEVERAVSELMPHYVCSYLYELAQEFNSFYEKNRVVGDERQQERALLVRAYSQVLRNGLKILGIVAPNHM